MTIQLDTESIAELQAILNSEASKIQVSVLDTNNATRVTFIAFDNGKVVAAPTYLKFDKESKV